MTEKEAETWGFPEGRTPSFRRRGYQPALDGQGHFWKGPELWARSRDAQRPGGRRWRGSA